VAVRFETSDPEELLSRIRSAIDDSLIETWSYDHDGDFTHTARQWVNEAWLRPSVSNNRLSFYIIPPQGKTISRTVYAIYHGRFIEAVLSHFDHDFKRAIATALPEGADRIKSA